MNRHGRWMAAAVVGLFLGAAGAARANNLQITNVTVSGRDNTTAYVQFDISWENSWRYAGGSDPLYFHDAAWVFFKVLPDEQTEWRHVTLEGTGTNPTDYDIGTGTPIELIVPDDRVGMFVRRSGEGVGTTAVQKVKAVWNFTSNSLEKTDNVKIQAFGLEMVYVAEGAFKVGSGGNESNRFYQYTDGSQTILPYQVTSTNAILTGSQNGKLWATGLTPPNNGSIPSSFPNGYAAFYCMKYSITQGQYKDFLNTLTSDQAATRNLENFNVGRMRITGTHPNFTTDAPDRACNHLSSAHSAAFADWAGLRPMTELEYEKACRGPLEPVANEYAFGKSSSSRIFGLHGGDDGSGTEAYAAGNLHVSGNGGPSGPVRVGIFATASSTRASAGASYWGIMELSGNLWERVISANTGLSFTGLHGNGVLAANGNATVSGWPSGVLRGGGWQDGGGLARVSDRSLVNSSGWGGDGLWRGSRAVRSAPSGLPAAP